MQAGYTLLYHKCIACYAIPKAYQGMEVIKSFEPSASRQVHHPGCVGDHHHSRGVKEEGRYLELNRLIPIFCGSRSEIFFWENGAPIKSKIAALRKFREAVAEKERSSGLQPPVYGA